MSVAQSEAELRTVLEAPTLDTTLDILQSAGDEAVLHLGKDGLQVSIIDAATVMMHHLSVNPPAFETVPSGSFPIGMNLETLQDHIAKAANDQTIEFGYLGETRKMSISYDKYNSKLACIDPDTIRKEPDTNDLDLENSVTLETSDLKDAIDQVALVTDHVHIVGDPDAEEIRFTGEGDTDEQYVTFDHDDVISAQVKKDCYSIYSVGYLEELSKVLPKGEVTLHFDQEFPLLIDYEYAGGYAEVETMIAPRVE